MHVSNLHTLGRIPPGARHQPTNTGDEPLVLLCAGDDTVLTETSRT